MKHSETVRVHIRNVIVLGVSLVILLGCARGANVTTSVRIPPPLVDPYPMTVGINFPSELTDYVYDERIGSHGKFVIEIGQNQRHVLFQVYSGLFEDLIEVESLDTIPEEVAGVLVPSIADVQITIPHQTRGDFYEVWIRYSIELLDSTGSALHKWNFAAYGKSNKRDYPNPMERANLALTDASESALRDAATVMVLDFTQPRKIPQVIRTWIANNST